MLTSLLIDNFRCFQNLEFRPQKLHGLFGPNGGGKTSLIDALRLMRAFICDAQPVVSLFPATSLTRWDRRDTQSIALVANLSDQAYRLEFAVEHDRKTHQARVAYERLFVGDQPLFAAELGQAQLYRDNGSVGPKVKLDWSRSGISAVAEGPDNAQLAKFRTWLRRMLFVDIVPATIRAQSEEESSELDSHAANFASWYRHMTLSSPQAVTDAFRHLSSVIPGFRQLRLVGDVRRTRLLDVAFRPNGESAGKGGTEYQCGFEELSDGQKCLTVLYCVLECLRDANFTVCFDEPDNYVAGSEIQPFLAELQAVLDESDSQAIVASHHPDLINILGPAEASWIDRPEGYQSRIEPFRFDESSGILPAEAVARGWNNE